MSSLISFKYQVGLAPEREVRFHEKLNLIYSSENSKGKTTLIRMILWALGYNVPDTKGISLDAMQYTIVGRNFNEKIIEVIRKNIDAKDTLTIIVDGAVVVSAGFIEHRQLIQQYMFGISNELILDNLLCTFYIDQEKGWTMLNRGKVVGGIQFSVESFLCGLGDTDISELKTDYAKITSDLSQYKKLLQFASLTDERMSLTGDLTNEGAHQAIEREEAELDVNITYLEEELASLKKIQKENKSLITLIDKLKLRVRSKEGEEIQICRENIVDLEDNINFLKSRILLLESETASLKKKKQTLRKSIFDEDAMLRSSDLLDVYKKRIKGIYMNQTMIYDAIQSLDNRRKEIQRDIEDLAHNSWEQILERHIRRYMKRMSVKNEYALHESVATTRKLSLFSGAEMSKRVLSFRFGYLKCIEEKYGLKLPIIIDSPYAKEIDGTNFGRMFDILNDDFCDYQVIIASIHNEDIPTPYFKITINNGIVDEDASCEMVN